MLSRRFFAVVSFAAIWCIHPILAQETNFDKLQRRAIDKANSPSKALQVILVGEDRKSVV